MPGTKRPIPEDVFEDDDAVHPSRKQRTENDQGRVELIGIFHDLKDEISETRLAATKALISTLSDTSKPDQPSRLDYAITRLVKGVCSASKAARPGFSVALTEVLRLTFAKTSKSSLTFAALIEKIIALTNPDGKAKGEETRNYLLGRQFAFQAVLRSQVLHLASEEDAKHVFDAIADLAAHKQWLRTECGAGLCGFVESEKATPTSGTAAARQLLQSWTDKGLIKSPEGVALWMTIRKLFPEAKFPKGIWHHNNPLAAQERPALTKILLQNSVDDDENTNGLGRKSGARQSTPNFAWTVVLSYLYQEGDEKVFSQFWTECVAQSMFSSSSSTERKSLGLQIFTKALASAPTSSLEVVVHPQIVQCILDQRVKSDRYLFEAAKTPLSQMVQRGKSDGAAAAIIAGKLLTSTSGTLDKLTKSTLETLLASVDDAGLSHVTETIVNLCKPSKKDKQADIERRRRILADAFLTLVRSHRNEPSRLFKDPLGKPRASNVAAWLRDLLETFTTLAYGKSADKPASTSDATRDIFRERISSALGQLMTLPLEQAIWSPFVVAEKLWDLREDLFSELSKDIVKIIKEARKTQKAALERTKGLERSSRTTTYAFHLLISMGMLQVYREEPDAVSVLDDIVKCQQSTGEEESSSMLIELLLCFVSKQSALFRKLAEQVFTAFAPEVTSDALESMIDILGQKESLAGQQELFKQNGEEDGSEDGEDDNDSDIGSDVDVEDASDVEIVNGKVNDDSDADSDDDSDAEEESSANEDEEAAFDRKLADALGTAGMEQDSDDDGSDMDDDQMMALDGHLTTIFTERKKNANKKKDNQDAKENIVNFKNRVLDLLEIYVKTQHANPIALDLVMPLVELSRTSTNAPTAKKALTVLEAYFDACKKNRIIPDAPEDVCFSLVEAALGEAKLGGSKVHASACSRSLQFLAKILVTSDPSAWQKIAAAYIDLQAEWRDDPKTKIHSSIFNDWHSWSMQR